MASGTDETPALDLVWTDGGRDVLLGDDALGALKALDGRLRVRRSEADRGGEIGIALGWLLWG